MEKVWTKRAAPASARVQTLVMTGLLTALACIATLVIHVASPTGGYLNLGDTVVLLGAYLLGPWYGALAAGLGSALADILSGAAIYAPATLVIKAAMAVLAGLLYRKLRGSAAGAILCGAAGELPMLAGYWLYDALLLRSFAGAAAGVPSNLVQAGFGIAVSVFLTAALRKSRYVRDRFPGL